MIYALTLLGVPPSDGYRLTPGVLFDLLAIRRQANGGEKMEKAEIDD